MTPKSSTRSRGMRPAWRAAAVAAVSLGALVLSGLTAQAASADAGTTVYAAPSGSDSSDCSQAAPCSIEHAKAVVEGMDKTGGITVQLADGTYRISSPLEFGANDGGGDSLVTWQAAPGANPVISGSTPVQNWQPSSAGSGIWQAATPAGLDTRQLYVNGVIAPRAGIKVSSSDVAVTATGITIKNAALNYLATLPDQGRIEFESTGDFTDRYSQVDSISGSTITMKQPGWNNNTWGWDTVQSSLLAAPTWYLENSLRFLTDVGQWYISPSDGVLYYKPAAGVDPNTLKIELPRLQTLVSISGTYDNPVKGLAFKGIQFSGTSWLAPSSAEGYADQQNGTFLTGTRSYRPADAFTSCARGCEMFERARTEWHQEPAAVQVSAASNVTFTGNTFTNLGQSALGVGNDANATHSGVGLGASNIEITGNRFFEDAGHGIAVGGVLPDAHHPSDPRMTNSDILIQDNTVNRVSVDYKDNGGILSTYVTRASILHNEVSNVPYDGIDTGYGWGINDAGGSADYVARGYYNWNPLYTTPTTLKDNRVEGNLVHNSKSKFADGGTVYNLSASPGTVIQNNYLYNFSGVALYGDEGTRYVTYQNNVLQGGGAWAFLNGYSTVANTGDNTLQNNWYSGGGASTPNSTLHRDVITNNVKVTVPNWPAAAQAVMCDAGVRPAYRTSLNANLLGLAVCPTSNPVGSPYSTYASVANSVFGQAGGGFGIAAKGTDVWGAGGQHDDQYGSIFQAQSYSQNAVVKTRVVAINDTNAWAKSGVMVRNDITKSGSSAGYAVVAVTGTNGVDFEWDANGDGYLDSSANVKVDRFRPIWVELSRSGNVYTASYSYDGANWVRIGSPVTLASAAALQDAGLFSTSHDANQWAVNQFDGLDVTSAPVFTAGGESQTVSEGSTLAFGVDAAAPSGDVITYSASGLPDGATFDPATHQFSWTPSHTQAGTYTVTFTATDGSGSESFSATKVVTIHVIYEWGGFQSPIDTGDVVNSVKAGSAVPIKFSLTGDHGTAILAAGSPTVQFGQCSDSATVDAIEQTATAGASGLQYDPDTDTYTYVWKTSKSWAGQCGTLVVALADGTTHTALFSFLK